MWARVPCTIPGSETATSRRWGPGSGADRGLPAVPDPQSARTRVFLALDIRYNPDVTGSPDSIVQMPGGTDRFRPIYGPGTGTASRSERLVRPKSLPCSERSHAEALDPPGPGEQSGSRLLPLFRMNTSALASLALAGSAVLAPAFPENEVVRCLQDRPSASIEAELARSEPGVTTKPCSTRPPPTPPSRQPPSRLKTPPRRAGPPSPIREPWSWIPATSAGGSSRTSTWSGTPPASAPTTSAPAAPKSPSPSRPYLPHRRPGLLEHDGPRSQRRGYLRPPPRTLARQPEMG